MSNITPSSLGLPRKFTNWRRLFSNKRNKTTQLDIATDIAMSDDRFNLLAGPTGSGKTVTNIVSALLSQPEYARYLYLVYTKALGNQIYKEFGSMIPLVEGMGNYQCLEASVKDLPLDIPCNEGICIAGTVCPLRNDGCTYYDARHTVESSSAGLTNFAYRGSLSRYSDPNALGLFDTLIIDEAHNLMSWLSDFCSIDLQRQVMKRHLNIKLPKYGNDVIAWSRWAFDNLSSAKSIYQESRNNRRASHTTLQLERLCNDLKVLSTLAPSSPSLSTSSSLSVVNNWVAEKTKLGTAITPIDPSRFVEQYVYRGARKIILSSASLSPVDGQLFKPTYDSNSDVDLDATLDNNDTYFQGGDGFDVANRPVIAIPTAKISYRSSRAIINTWLHRIDELISTRLQWRGVIDTVSYDRAKLIYDRSQYQQHMILHRRGQPLVDALEKYLSRPPPSIILSPVLYEGYDLKYDEGRWYIVTKMPFPNPSSLLVQARIALYKSMKRDYMKETAAKGVMQRVGRIVRVNDDWGEGLIIDNPWYQYVCKSPALPDYFKRACVTCYNGLPKPLGLSR